MRVWLEFDRKFGFRFVHAMLPPDFSHLTRYRVLKLMRELGIRGCTPNAKKRTTIPDPKAKPRPDLVRRDFTSPVLTYKLVGDITYLRTGEDWLYLATVIDLCARMVVGWSLSDRMTADIAVAALESAKSHGYVAGNAIFHSNSGAQYTSRTLPRQRRGGVVLRHAEERDALQDELHHQGQRKHVVIEFIEADYNRKRPHSTIGYQIPANAMESFFERTKPAEEGLPMAA